MCVYMCVTLDMCGIKGVAYDSLHCGRGTFRPCSILEEVQVNSCVCMPLWTNKQTNSELSEYLDIA